MECDDYKMSCDKHDKYGRGLCVLRKAVIETYGKSSKILRTGWFILFQTHVTKFTGRFIYEFAMNHSDHGGILHVKRIIFWLNLNMCFHWRGLAGSLSASNWSRIPFSFPLWYASVIYLIRELTYWGTE